MSKIWEGIVSCSCKEQHTLYCLSSDKPTGSYKMKYKCLKAHQDLKDSEFVEVSSKLISNFVNWDNLKSWSASAIICEVTKD